MSVQVKRQHGQDKWSSYGDYDGRHNAVFHLHDDYSFPGANGNVWLCGLTTHGSAAWSVQRIQGMAPHWCYEETVVVEKGEFFSSNALWECAAYRRYDDPTLE